MNVFQEIGGSVAGVKAYPQFLKNRAGKVIGYVFLLVTLAFLVGNIKGFIGTSIFASTMEDKLAEVIPDFSLENGRLYMEEPIYLEEDTALISFDSDTDVVFDFTESEWRDMLRDYEDAIVGDSKGIVFKSDGEFQIVQWPKDISVSRDTLKQFLPIIPIVMVVIYVLSYFGSLIGYFLGALILALLGLIVASAQKYRFSFGQIYVLSIYSKTLACILKAIFKLTGLSSIPVLGVMLSFGLIAACCAYLILAMAHIDRERKAQMQVVNQMNGYPM